MNARKASMAGIANDLGRQPGRTVIDRTGLSGAFDFTLVWAADQASESVYPPLSTALREQLGLKLESTRGPVDVIIIDSVGRPSEN